MVLPFPFGVNLTQIVSAPPDRRDLLNFSGSNRIDNARYINPQTLDFEISPNGHYVGMNSVDQEVQLALTTTLGTAAQTSLGTTIKNVKTITPNVVSLIQSSITQALQPMVLSSKIVINNISVSVPFPNQISVQLAFTNLFTATQITWNLPLTYGSGVQL